MVITNLAGNFWFVVLIVLYPALALIGGAVALYSLVPRGRPAVVAPAGARAIGVALALSVGCLLLLAQRGALASMARNVALGAPSYRLGVVLMLTPLAVELVVLAIVIGLTRRRALGPVTRTVWIAVAANLLLTLTSGIY